MPTGIINQVCELVTSFLDLVCIHVILEAFSVHPVTWLLQVTNVFNLQFSQPYIYSENNDFARPFYLRLMHLLNSMKTNLVELDTL